jgi:putative peptide zinc metalloprotease protein
MYKEIQIIETDFEDKYLIKYKEKTMYVGYIVRDIIEFLKEGKNNTEIHSSITDKYSIDLKIDSINDIIDNKINIFIVKNEATTFRKIVKIFDPSVLILPKIIFKIFEPICFYVTLLVLCALHIYIYNYSFHSSANSFEDIFITYILLFGILILHELGHSFAAKKYNVDVKEIGFGIYYILPVFYVDLNEAWKLEKSKRVIINLSGIYFQLFSGILLFLLSVIFKNQSNILMNLYFINLSIVILNLNPFLKFDGYWILSDLINENDLNTTSNLVIKDLMKFKKPNKKWIVILYSISKFIFIYCVVTLLIKSIYSSVLTVIKNGHIDLYAIFPLLIFCFIIYKMLKKLLNKKYEKRNRKSQRFNF